MNNKPKIVFYGAVDTHSGYGARSRDIVKSILKLNKYDLKIISCRWGSTPLGFLNPNILEHKQILDCILPNNQLTYQPDLWIMCTVGHEMQKVGKQNWLITAGIETTITPADFIEGCNRADLVLVSSNHSKKSLLESKFEKRENGSNKLLEVIECKTPVEILMEGYDESIYKKLDKVNFNLDYIKEEFCFLYTGHWLPGSQGEDRKNTSGLIKTFLETFKNKKNKPALILKTSCGSYSIVDRELILDKIEEIKKQVQGELPNIYLIHGGLTDEEMNELYNHSKVKAMVNFTKGEGYGRPLLEFTITQKPVITSAWSGQVDFLDKNFSILLPGQLTNVHESAANQFLLKESQWFTVDYKIASITLQNVYLNYNRYLDGAKRQAYKSKTEFNLEKMQEKLESYLNKVPFVEIKPFVLPTLKRIPQQPVNV